MHFPQLSESSCYFSSIKKASSAHKNGEEDFVLTKDICFLCRNKFKDVVFLLHHLGSMKQTKDDDVALGQKKRVKVR